MKLRVENYFVDGQTFAKLFVNDEYLYTVRYYAEGDKIMAEVSVNGEVLYTTETTNGEKIAPTVTKVDIRALKAASLVAYIDNVSLSGSAQTYQP